jgi:D-glycero-D-manno-heptose 1,7-bisphosphate phosphatase
MSATDEQLRPAIFLDRDGTIIEDRGHLADPSEIAFLPGAIDALQILQRHFVLFIVTNQSGVSKGQISLEQVATVNADVVSNLEKAGVTIERVFVCPHARSEGCVCIKPKPYFLRLAEREHQIDLLRSYTIGDHPHDVEFARSVGATGIYVLTGHGEKHRADLDPSFLVAPCLADALPLFATRRSCNQVGCVICREFATPD